MGKRLYAVSLMATKQYQSVDVPYNVVVQAAQTVMAALGPDEKAIEDAAMFKCHKAFSEEDGYSRHAVTVLAINPELVKKACNRRHTTVLETIAHGVSCALCTLFAIVVAEAAPLTPFSIGLIILLMANAVVTLSAFYARISNIGE